MFVGSLGMEVRNQTGYEELTYSFPPGVLSLALPRLVLLITVKFTLKIKTQTFEIALMQKCACMCTSLSLFLPHQKKPPLLGTQ